MFFDEVDPNGPIFGFQGDYRFLSNFWPAEVVSFQLTFASVEHAYQSGKQQMHDAKELFSTKNKLTAGQAKRLGKQLPIRPGWDDFAPIYMRELVLQKFTKHADLRELLLATGDRHIYELNNWGDTFWGVVTDKHGRLSGFNTLGNILMETREKVKCL